MNLSDAQYAALKRRMAGGERIRPQDTPHRSEQEEQEAVIDWARIMEGQYHELALLFHVPNGGDRPIQAGVAMKRAGTKAGVPDLVMCCKRRTPDGRHYGALFIELKRANHSNGPSPAQEWWIDQLRAQGYMAIVAYGADEAIEAIEHYLMLEPG